MASTTRPPTPSPRSAGSPADTAPTCHRQRGRPVLNDSLRCLAYRGRCVSVGQAGRSPAEPLDVSPMRGNNQTFSTYFLGAELVTSSRAHDRIAALLSDSPAARCACSSTAATRSPTPRPPTPTPKAAKPSGVSCSYRDHQQCSLTAAANAAVLCCGGIPGGRPPGATLILIRDWPLSRQAAVDRPVVLRPGRVGVVWVLGCGGEGDGVAEGLEFGDEALGFFSGSVRRV